MNSKPKPEIYSFALIKALIDKILDNAGKEYLSKTTHQLAAINIIEALKEKKALKINIHVKEFIEKTVKYYFQENIYPDTKNKEKE